MIQSSRGERKALTKQSHPAGTSTDVGKTQTGSRSWSSSALKNPRIVRVSRSFGGKDRHSKVRTIRGLRDRRVRLSVPTAIQLYELQDKLGLNQPSKVVDWLLSAAQHEIDKLPPLEMLQLGGDHQDLFDQLPPQPNLSNLSSQPFDFVCANNAVKDHYKRMDSEKAQAPAPNFLKRSNESDEGNAVELGHHGFVLESSNPNSYYNLESSASNSTNNYLISQSQEVNPGYHHPIAILASYMAAASSYNVGVAAAGSSASQNASSGALKFTHEASNIIVPNLMAHDLHRDGAAAAAAAAAARALHHQYQ